MTLRRDQLLWEMGDKCLEDFGTLVRRTSRADEADATFSRSGAAYFWDHKAGKLRQAESGVYRAADWEKAGGEWRRGLTLELEREQLLTAPEDFSDAAWSVTGTSVVSTDDAVAPDGSSTADKLTDNDGASIERVDQTETVPDDSADRVASAFVKKQTSFSTTFELALFYTGPGTTVSYLLQLNPASGDIDASRGETPTDFGVRDRGDYWRLWVAGPNNGTGNDTLNVSLRPAINASGADGTTDNSATGSAHAWGANLTAGEFPTSYIDSASTRPADSISFTGGPDGSEALVGYVRWVSGTVGAGGAGAAMVIGKSAATPNSLLFWDSNDNLVWRYRDSGGISSSSTVGIVPSLGTLYEAAFHIASDGSTYLVLHENGIAAGSATGASTTNGLAPFATRTVPLNADEDDSGKGAQGFYRAFFAKASAVDAPLDGTDDAAFMSEMRGVWS